MMKRSYDETILRLPGTAEEKQWLAEHLEVLSVRERIVLSAAMAREPPRDMAAAVNCLLSLDEYEVRGHAGNYADLGERFLFEQCVPQDQHAYFDLTALGEQYEDQHPGMFIGNCYVKYPPSQPVLRYGGEVLPGTEGEDWIIRLQLASEAVPAGVWVRVPDHRDDPHGAPGETGLALDHLRVKSIRKCTLLDTRCALSCVQNVNGQYADLSGLIHAAEYLGGLLADGCRNQPDFMWKLTTALEFENCHRLDDVARIARDLDSYDVISREHFLDQVTQELSGQAWAKGGDAVKGCFDYAAYAAALAEWQGYQTTADGLNYIRKQDSPVLEHQQGGMTMQ